MTLQDIENLFKDIEVPVYYSANTSEPSEDKYIVWAEDGDSSSSNADNKKRTKVTSGTIDLFTRTKFDPKKKEIEAMLNNSSMAWSYNSHQYEEDMLYHHHEWVFEVILSG